MKVSYNWLSQYIPQHVALPQLSDILTGIGLEVETIEQSGIIPGGLEGLVIGRVESCIPHPNADKLKITTLNTGTEAVLTVVCGAPNVAAGQKVIVAPVGTYVHPLHAEKFQIKKAKIRGQISEGMICAEDEIGLGESHAGILVLPEDAPLGMSARAYFKIPDPDFTIHIGLTPNRSDANSHLGVAKDVCAYLSHHQKQTLQVRYPAEKESIPAASPLPLQLEVKASDNCPRYAGIILSGIKVAPSPEWLRQRLLTVGINPINNVVDVTNFVLQEFGQPLHAFDYDQIAGKKITVQHAKEGSKFTTLDNKERTLREEDLMIYDGEKPISIAGIFGGAQSGISEATTTVFLESAYFNPRSIRRSSMHHGLRTEAATHFEKGVAMEFVIPALKRAAALLMELSGAEIASDIFDVYPVRRPAREISLSLGYLNKLCGKKYEPESVQGILTSLGFEVNEDPSGNLIVSVPAENTDMHHAADLAEEILRIDGLDKIAISRRLQFSLPESRSTFNLRALKEHIARYLADAGLQEIVTNSITNSKYYPDQSQVVKLINNLSNELDIMRPKMLESGLEVILHNVNRKMQDIKIFEFGKTYRQIAPGNYEQNEVLSIWLSGNMQPQNWQHKAERSDIYMLKGLVANICSLCGLLKVQEIREEDMLFFKRGKTEIANLSKVSGKLLNDFNIKQDVFYAEIAIQNLAEAIEKNKVKYKELAKYPAVKRDLALILPKSTGYEQVAAITKKQKMDALADFELFDVFEHEKLGKDKKSLALSFTFQRHDRTLTDEEVDLLMKTLVTEYEKELNATIRS
jgi:phenylalanyl-tRNA synthetase beta chain